MARASSPLRRLLAVYNAALIPLASLGLLATALGLREDSTIVALLGALLTLASPFIAYTIVASRMKRLLAK